MIKKVLVLLSIFSTLIVVAQHTQTFQKDIQWEGIKSFDNRLFLSITDADDYTYEGLPVCSFILYGDFQNLDIKVKSLSYSAVNAEEEEFVSTKNIDTLSFKKVLGYQQKKARWIISFIPLAINPEKGIVEKITHLEIEVLYDDANISMEEERSYVDQSVLIEGDWYKLSIDTTGIYKIDYSDIQAMGYDPQSLELDKIGLFGNGGRMLPEALAMPREDDLLEVAIEIVGGEDGIFDEGDYVLFYGEGPDVATYHKNGYYTYENNYYSTKSYYYFTPNQGNIKRIENAVLNSNAPTDTVTSFTSMLHYEKDVVNIIHSGRRWYGEQLELDEKESFGFKLQDPVLNTDFKISYAAATKIFSNGKVAFDLNGELKESNIIFFKPDLFTAAYHHTKSYIYPLTSSELNFDFYCIPNNTSSRIYFDFLTLNYQRYLKFSTGFMTFVDTAYQGAKDVLFKIQSPENVKIWNITDKEDIENILFEENNGNLQFVSEVDDLEQFVILEKGFNFQHPSLESEVENQSIHSSSTAQMIIVSPVAYLEQAQRLADLHYAEDGFTSLVFSDEMVYNEFSSGKPSPVAIRNMMKFFYQSFDDYPKFLTLFADGSYDNKGIYGEIPNQIPVYETLKSLSRTNSLAIEDFFAILDNAEGEGAMGIMDIAVGRFCVSNLTQATEMVDKVEKYMQDTDQIGEWQRKFCFIADDGEGDLFLAQCDTLASRLERLNPKVETVKLYFDVYQQLETPIGERYPDVQEKIHDVIDEGALIIDYIGHGSEIGWANERVLTIGDINGWNNDKYPLLITATCEFSRFDGTDEVSGGELAYLNPHGGAIAMITTYRLAWAGANHTMNKKFFQNIFNIEEGKYPRLGTVYLEAKNLGSLSRKNMGIFGDPAINLKIPSYTVDSIYFVAQNKVDTLQSLMKIPIKANVYDILENPIDNFQGTAKVQLYDKERLIETVGNDDPSRTTTFLAQDILLWETEVEVVNGVVETDLFVPLDMYQDYGTGLVRIFAKDEKKSAMGAFREFILGGTDENAEVDNIPPEVSLFINNNEFHNGDTIQEAATLLADLSDEHGINISQQGLGHQMRIFVDENSQAQYLSDFYHADINTMCCGNVVYDLGELEEGEHTILFEVWDNYNNKATAEVSFYLSKEKEKILNRIYIAPNPLKTYTNFYFANTSDFELFDVQLFVYDLKGKERYSYRSDVFTLTGDFMFHTWNGRDTEGHKLSSGMYLYYVLIRDKNGREYVQTQKILIQN